MHRTGFLSSTLSDGNKWHSEYYVMKGIRHTMGAFVLSVPLAAYHCVPGNCTNIQKDSCKFMIRCIKMRKIRRKNLTMIL